MTDSTEADIVAELRSVSRLLGNHGLTDAGRIVRRAAKEVERLRAERDAAANQVAVLQEVNADLLAAAQLETEKADAAARDMRERCVAAVRNESLENPTTEPDDISYGWAIRDCVGAIEALPLIATDRKAAT